MDSKVVNQFAGKLGLSDEVPIVDKAKEFLRLLSAKSGSALSVMGDYAKIVICLDLATGLYGHAFDMETGLKLSGFKKPTYVNHRRIIEKMLDLNKPIGVPEICIQLGITEIQPSCLDLLEKYGSSKENTLKNIDIRHPQYPTMAVYQICKLKGIKIQKAKLINFSHLKPSQWSILEKSWEKWFEQNPTIAKEYQSKIKKSHKKFESNIDDQKEEIPTDDIDSNPQSEDYLTWKARVLKKAFEDIERLQKSIAT